MRDVQVTLQDVHHPRGHENGQRLAGYVGYPEVMVRIGSAGITLATSYSNTPRRALILRDFTVLGAFQVPA